MVLLIGPPDIRFRRALLRPALRLRGARQAIQKRQRGPAPCRYREFTLSGWHISAATRAAFLPASYFGHLIAADKVTQPPSLAPPWGPVAAPLHARSLRASIGLPAPIIQQSPLTMKVGQFKVWLIGPYWMAEMSLPLAVTVSHHPTQSHSQGRCDKDFTAGPLDDGRVLSAADNYVTTSLANTSRRQICVMGKGVRKSCRSTQRVDDLSSLRP